VTKTMAKELGSNSLERALAIMETISTTSGGLTLSEVVRRLHLPASTCHYILTRLTRHGYLVKQPDTKHYEIGVKLIAIAHGALREMKLRVAAEPVLHRLAEETGMGAFVGVLERSTVMIVGKVERPGALPMDMEIGVRYPAHRTALGKVLLANLSAPEQMKALSPARAFRKWQRNALHGTLLAELTEVKRRGYATNDEELFPGIRALAAPIEGVEAQAKAAVSVTGGRLRIDDRKIIAAVRTAAHEISKRLFAASVRKGN